MKAEEICERFKNQYVKPSLALVDELAEETNLTRSQTIKLKYRFRDLANRFFVDSKKFKEEGLNSLQFVAGALAYKRHRNKINQSDIREIFGCTEVTLRKYVNGLKEVENELD